MITVTHCCLWSSNCRVSRVHGKLSWVVRKLTTTIILAWNLADDQFFFKFSLFALLRKFVISPENRKKIESENQRKQCNMKFPRLHIIIVKWTNKNNGREYSKYLGCETAKVAKLSREWIPLARISFGPLLLINSISNMKQMLPLFLKNSQLNCRPWNVRVKNKQTNKKEQNGPFFYYKSLQL